MTTIEINSIPGSLKSIELIIDGISKVYPATFLATSEEGNRIMLKSRDRLIPICFISLDRLRINGNPVGSAREAASLINELANYQGDGSGGGSGGSGEYAVWE